MMGLIGLVCIIVGLLSVIYFLGYIGEIIKKRGVKDLSYFKLNLKQLIIFIIVAPIIIILTIYMYDSSLKGIIFPNDIRYKEEGTYCYFVELDTGEMLPAKITKIEDVREEEHGESTSLIHFSRYMLDIIYDKNKEYDFEEQYEEIELDKYSNVYCMDDNGNEKSFKLKLTNIHSNYKTFDESNNKINYVELSFEVSILISEIILYIITIIKNFKGMNKEEQ